MSANVTQDETGLVAAVDGGEGGSPPGSTPSWTELFDEDFSALPDQNLLTGGDGAKLINGKTYHLSQSSLLDAAEVGASAGGLLLTWKNNVFGRWFTSSRVGPYVYIFLSELLGTLPRGKELRIDIDFSADARTSDESYYPGFLSSTTYDATRMLGYHLGEFAGLFTSGYPTSGDIFRQNSATMASLVANPTKKRIEITRDRAEVFFGDGAGGWITSVRTPVHSLGFLGRGTEATAPALFFAMDRINTSGSLENMIIERLTVYGRDSESTVWREA